jgi:hypothetical protein
MKRWIKMTALTVAVLNLMMLLAYVYPVSTVGLAYAGNDPPKLRAQPIGDDQPNLLPDSCHRLGNCHGFWNCLRQALRCARDILKDIPGL